MLQGPAHGYDLVERLRAYDTTTIDPSLIYRALRGMEEDGLITSAWDEEKTQGPPRRVYTLSDQGLQALRFYIEDLKFTRDRINQLIDAYSKHAPDDK